MKFIFNFTLTQTPPLSSPIPGQTSDASRRRQRLSKNFPARDYFKMVLKDNAGIDGVTAALVGHQRINIDFFNIGG